MVCLLIQYSPNDEEDTIQHRPMSKGIYEQQGKVNCVIQILDCVIQIINHLRLEIHMWLLF